MAITYKEGVKRQIHQLRNRQRELWKPHESLQLFLAEYFPDEWERVKNCTYSARIFEAQDGTGRFKVTPECCHCIPFCIGCNKRMAYRRIKAAMDKFHRTTPAGEKPAFIHIVQTAPLRQEPDGTITGWGMAASQDVPRFAKLMTDSLRELYGPGIGGVMSYQDFGERGFEKRAPHLDLTLNGWMFDDDGQAVPTPKYDLTHGGRDRWEEVVQNHARCFDIDAWRGNAWLSRRVVGVKAYWKALKYQMRELVDFRKIQYVPAERAVYWQSYRENKQTKMSVAWFLHGLDEYQRRLGRWGKYQTRHLHRSFGFMSDRSIGAAQARMGGEPLAHGSSCPCSDCGDWARVPLRDIEEWLGPPGT